ncbi:PTS system mannose/fructose/sorbose family transporter subunit IID [candidate division KSB1 bacterium]
MNDQNIHIEKTHARKRLSIWTLFNITVRSFFIQSLFTFQEKIGPGLGFLLYPGLRRIAKDKESLILRLHEHSNYFNSHPYLASFIAGSILSIEGEFADDPELRDKQLNNIKTRLGGTLGSLGDRFFWKYLKPCASIIALTIIFLFYDYFPWNYFMGAACFLIIFNGIHLFYRFYGVFSGYSSGMSVIRKKAILKIEKLNFVLICISLFMLGILLVNEVEWIYSQRTAGIPVFITALILSFYFNYKKASPWLSITAGLGSSLILFIIHVLING